MKYGVSFTLDFKDYTREFALDFPTRKVCQIMNENVNAEVFDHFQIETREFSISPHYRSFGEEEFLSSAKKNYDSPRLCTSNWDWEF